MKDDKQRVVFLEGKKVVLRPLNKETDLESVVRWVNNQKVTQYLNMYLPKSFDLEKEWFDNLSKRESDIVLAIETLEGVFIGTVGLHNINSKDGNAMHGILIGEEDYWGGGYGTDTGMILLDYAFNQLNLRKICSSIIGFNKRSLNYHLRCGYKEIGRWRNHVYKNGEYYDLILLEVFKEEWLNKWRMYQEKTKKIPAEKYQEEKREMPENKQYRCKKEKTNQATHTYYADALSDDGPKEARH